MSRVLTIQAVPYRAKFHKVLLYRTVPSSKVLFEYCTVFSLKHERVMYTVPSLYLLRFQHMLMFRCGPAQTQLVTCTIIQNKIGLLWCHSHVELRLIEIEVDWSWGWLKLKLIEVEVDWSWGWSKLRLNEVEVDWSWGWLKLRLIELRLIKVEVDWSWGWLK